MSPPSAGNLFSGSDRPEAGEAFTELLRCRNVTVERISSSAAPEQILYDQEQDEWVVLIEGRATLEIEGASVDLTPGDYLFIPAGTRHRVVATAPEPRCLWLAVHIHPEEAK